MDQLKAVLLTPTRVVLLALVLLSLVVAGVSSDAPSQGGLVGLTQLAGGVSILAIAFGWRWFWRGYAVQRSYQRMMERRLNRL